MWREQRDLAGAMLVVGTDQLEESRAFLSQVAGFEEERVWRDGDGQPAMVGFRYGPSRVQMTVPGALPDVPDQPSAGVVLTFTVQDVAGLHGVMLGRAGDAAGPLRDLGSATAFTLYAPAGFQLMFLSYLEESPQTFGGLKPEA